MDTRSIFPGGVKLTTHLHLLQRSRMVELYVHFPICLQSVMQINKLGIISIYGEHTKWEKKKEKTVL
jgi:hypothetical protein